MQPRSQIVFDIPVFVLKLLWVRFTPDNHRAIQLHVNKLQNSGNKAKHGTQSAA